MGVGRMQPAIWDSMPIVNAHESGIFELTSITPDRAEIRPEFSLPPPIVFSYIPWRAVVVVEGATV
jgi:hypothetical protein